MALLYPIYSQLRNGKTYDRHITKGETFLIESICKQFTCSCKACQAKGYTIERLSTLRIARNDKTCPCNFSIGEGSMIWGIRGSKVNKLDVGKFWF